MSSGQNLSEQLAVILNEGFSEEFVTSCARTFEQYSFPEDNLPTARLYLFYLSAVLKIIVSDSPQWQTLMSIGQKEEHEINPDNMPERAGKLIQESQVEPSAGNIALAIGTLTYLYASKNKKSGEEFLTLFVNSWYILCAYPISLKLA